MSTAVSPTDDPGEIADAQIPDVAASGYRERAIRDYLLSLGGTDGLSVKCIPELTTATIEQDSREEAPTIRIPARDFPQRTHDYSQEVANRLIQYGLALHEHGHDRYTAGPFLKEIFNRAEFSQPYGDLYWDCINGFEDYRIETALIEAEGKWAEERLMFTHQNFTYVPPEQTPDPENITWATAIQSATIHYGKARETFDFQPILEDESNQSLQWKSTLDKQIYDTILPELKRTLEAVSSEPDGKAAVRRMMEFVHSLDEFLDELSDDPPERDQEQEDSVDNSGDDQQNDMGSQKESADSLEQSDESGDQGRSEETDDTTGDPSDSSTSGSESEQEDGPEAEHDTEEQAESGGTRETDSSNAEGKNEAESETDSDGVGSPDHGGEQEKQDNGDGDDSPDSKATTSGDPDSAGEEKEDNPSSSQQPVETVDDSVEDDEETDDATPGGDPKEATEDSSDQSSGRAGTEQESNQSPSGEQQEHDEQQEAGESERDGGEEPSGHQPEGSEAAQSESTQESSHEPEPALVERESRKASHEERKLERDKQELEREIERLQAAVASGDGEVDRLRMVDPSDESGNSETWDDITTEARILKGPLQQSLQQSQRTSERRGTHTGTFEPSLSHRLSVSNLAINKRTTDGQKKSYSVVLVLDRSGSMAQQISTAEVAVGGFALALEQLGVNVAIVDLYRSNARMVKPFGTPTRQVRNNLTSKETGGGTPLSDALVVSRERVRQEPHFPFMFVVSDGKPHNSERYLTALEETHFPVVGVTLTQSSSAGKFDEYYDVCRSARPDDIGDELVSLATEMMF
ncbi:VWA domain-containing protein [Haloarcula sp. 1CSR25-25]|jgi:hypothetical protein|uniref:VWA domain-containing protein n=1 Tax=Haloarcula sp. 1CSR25-25 TaxID=2862545 RepID=UPI00289395ED|nr:VWA domain-containing protein [Haloarcula sp. 1CSR25-25]MDT3437840.1 VWA domain-containing protein [Haloarcula sp. 1CSR25-25]